MTQKRKAEVLELKQDTKKKKTKVDSDSGVDLKQESDSDSEVQVILENSLVLLHTRNRIQINHQLLVYILDKIESRHCIAAHIYRAFFTS